MYVWRKLDSSSPDQSHQWNMGVAASCCHGVFSSRDFIPSHKCETSTFIIWIHLQNYIYVYIFNSVNIGCVHITIMRKMSLIDASGCNITQMQKVNEGAGLRASWSHGMCMHFMFPHPMKQEQVPLSSRDQHYSPDWPECSGNHGCSSPGPQPVGDKASIQ